MILFSPARRQTLSVPRHDPVKRGTLRSLIRLAGLTPEEFVRLLRWGWACHARPGATLSRGAGARCNCSLRQ